MVAADWLLDRECSVSFGVDGEEGQIGWRTIDIGDNKSIHMH